MNCYRFPDRATFLALAAAEGLVNDDGELITSSHTYAIDEIGVITKGGLWDEETAEVIEPPTVPEEISPP